jgi:hypothetical protein
VSSSGEARIGRVDGNAADWVGGKEEGESQHEGESDGKVVRNAPLCPSICHLFASSFGVLKSRKMRPPSLSEAARRKEKGTKGGKRTKKVNDRVKEDGRESTHPKARYR